mmetsp:Transcript_10994/g.23120  ORF Transcript_10994/g.23120 Transcript_10994/m.23120 type:complete len:368 (-) Transcript_10994:544-1647(-)
MSQWDAEVDDTTDQEASKPGYCFECQKPGHWFLDCHVARARVEDELDGLEHWQTRKRAYLEGLLSKFSESEDADPFPFNDVVYRALRPEEQPEKGLFPPVTPAAQKKMSVVQAIATGSSQGSHYIHTSRSRDIALKKYAGRAELQKGDRVAVIDLTRLPETTRIVDGMDAAAEDCGTGSKAFRFARFDQEVVLDGPVPGSAIIDVVEFVEAPKGVAAFSPSPMRRKMLVHDCDWRDERLETLKRRKPSTSSPVFDKPLHRQCATSPKKSNRCEFKVAGVTFHQNAVRTLKVGDEVLLQKDDHNPHDKMAVKVLSTKVGHACQLGYIPKDMTFAARQLLAINGKRKAKVSDLHVWRENMTGVTVAVSG